MDVSRRLLTGASTWFHDSGREREQVVFSASWGEQAGLCECTPLARSAHLSASYWQTLDMMFETEE
eukprot:1604497-Pleurochrysis_carterae.AAC.2